MLGAARLGARLVVLTVIAAATATAAPHRAISGDVLRIATDVWLPYENVSDPNAPGFSTEVVAWVLKQMNVESETVVFPWARAIREVFAGRRDALYTAFWTKERARYCHYPDEPLARERWVYFVRSANVAELSFTRYEELKSRRIGILRGASVTEEFWKFVKQNGNYEEVETDDINFRKLLKGRLDYVVTSHSNGIKLIRDMKLTGQIEPLPAPVIKEDELFIIFSRKTINADFVETFSETLRRFKSTSDYGVLYEKYFGVEGG